MKKLSVTILSILTAACGGGGDSAPAPAPAQSVDVFFIYGQSNGSGSAEDMDTTPAEHGELWDVLNGQPVAVQDPTRYDGMQLGSAWPAFADAYYDATGRTAVIVNASFGGRGMHELLPGTNIGQRAFGWLGDALAYYEAAGVDVSTVSMVFVHGEYDSGWNTSHNAYFEGLAAISDHLDGMTPLYDTTYVHRVGVNWSYPVEGQQRFISLGDAQIERTKDRGDWRPVYASAPTYNQENALMGSDYSHYSQAGYDTMGEAIANNIAGYQRGEPVAQRLYAESAELTIKLRGDTNE